MNIKEGLVKRFFLPELVFTGVGAKILEGRQQLGIGRGEI
jgi:hypothetical protein